MKKSIILCLSAMLCAVLLCACGGEGQEQQDGVPAEEPYPFTLDYHRCAPMVERQVGGDMVQAAGQVIDAFLAGETSVSLPQGEYGGNPGNNLGYALNSMFPLFLAATDYNDNHFDAANNTVSWQYTQSEEEIQKALAALAQTTEACMGRLRAGDSDMARALLLYQALTEKAAYDYETVSLDADSAEFQFRTSSYAALVLHSGVCNSFAQALAFLYTQAGLDCAAVMGDSASAGFHMWLMAELDGQWYYFDPTWDAGGTWRYFGMTAEDRASWGGEFTDASLLGQDAARLAALDDRRFETLHGYDWQEMTVDREKQEAIFTSGEEKVELLLLKTGEK